MEGRFQVEDFSSNGTYLNGQVIGKGNKVTLRDGDKIQIVFDEEEQIGFEFEI